MGGSTTGTAVSGSPISGGPLSFETIYQTVMKAIGDSSYARSDEVKAIVNQVYLNEILSCDELYPLFWLLYLDDSRKTKAAATITGITKASPAVITAASHGFVTGDIVTLYDIAGMTEFNSRTVVVSRVDANSFQALDFNRGNIDSSGFTTYSSGGSAVFRGTAITNCRRIIDAGLHGYSNSLKKISQNEIETEAKWMDESTSRPLRYRHHQAFNVSDGTQYDYLLTYPGADAAYSMRAWIEKNPARLVNTTDIPYLPLQFCDAIIAGAITRLGETKVQVEAGVIWPSVYNMHLDAIRAYNRQWWHEHEKNEKGGFAFLK